MPDAGQGLQFLDDLFIDHCSLIFERNARNRNYSPSLGRWINQDPAGYINGANTYQFVESNPANAVDPWGLVQFVIEPIGSSVGDGDLEGDPGGVLETGGLPGYPSEGPIGPPTNPVNGALLNNSAQQSTPCPVQPWSNGPAGPMMNPKYGFPKVPSPPPPPPRPVTNPPPGGLPGPPGPDIAPNGQSWGFW